MQASRCSTLFVLPTARHSSSGSGFRFTMPTKVHTANLRLHPSLTNTSRTLSTLRSHCHLGLPLPNAQPRTGTSPFMACPSPRLSAVHEMYAPGGSAVAPLEAEFGAVLDDAGAVSRDALSALLRKEPSRLDDLNRIVHPLVSPSRTRTTPKHTHATHHHTHHHTHHT